VNGKKTLKTEDSVQVNVGGELKIESVGARALEMHMAAYAFALGHDVSDLQFSARDPMLLFAREQMFQPSVLAGSPVESIRSKCSEYHHTGDQVSDRIVQQHEPTQAPRKSWVAPTVVDLPRLVNLTLQTGGTIPGDGSIIP